VTVKVAAPPDPVTVVSDGATAAFEPPEGVRVTDWPDTPEPLAVRTSTLMVEDEVPLAGTLVGLAEAELVVDEGVIAVKLTDALPRVVVASLAA